MVAKKTLKSKKKTTKESTEKTVKELCGFSELNCRCCGKGNDEIGGFLLQCATCKKAHYCSKECFNKDLPKHMEFCQTNEPLHRAPKHRVDEEVKLSTTISPANDEKERWDKSLSADTRVKYCSSKLAERGSENVSFRESPLSGNAESEEQNLLNVKADSTVCSLGLHNSSDKEYASATDPQQIASSKKTDCESKGSDSVVDTTAYDTQKDECLDYFSVTENGPDVVRINDQSQLKADIAADECLNTMEKSDTADSRHSAKSGKVLCGARDIRASDRGFRKPKRSTSLSRDEGMSDMSDSDGSYCGNLSDSTLHMSDMTESEGEVARRTLRRQREAFASDFAAEKPKRFDSSSSLERVIVSIDQPIDETGNVVNPTSSCMEQEPCISLTVSEEIATSDSFSDSSINSGTETPYQLQRKKGFIIRRQHGNKNHALSDDHDSSPKGGGAVSEFCKEEMRMKKRLNNLWSLPEATIVEKRTEKRGKLQLSRSMKREKGRMHRCLGNLWKLSAASRADKADSGFAFEEWSDLEDSDSEEIRKRRGGGTLGFSDTVTVNSQKLTTETVTLKHLKASEPKHIGWERPEWTEYQLRSTAEGKLIKNAGNLAALKSRGNDKPEWASHSSLRKISIGSKLKSQRSFAAGSNRVCTNELIEPQNIESCDSIGKLKATERGTMLKRVGSIRLSNRKNASCEFIVKRSTSTLSRSSSGSISVGASGTKMKNKIVELDEKRRNDKISLVRRPNDSIAGEDISQKAFDRARILRTTSRGAKLLRGESLRRNHDVQV